MLIALLLMVQTTPRIGDLPQEIDPSEIPGMGAPVPPQTMQAPQGQTDSSAIEPPSKRAMKVERRQVESMGNLYEVYGHCAGSMTPDEVEAVLRPAQDQSVVGPYLLQRYTKGFKSPRPDEWCRKATGG